mgnify:CR=1 FL=1
MRFYDSLGNAVDLCPSCAEDSSVFEDFDLPEDAEREVAEAREIYSEYEGDYECENCGTTLTENDA